MPSRTSNDFRPWSLVLGCRVLSPWRLSPVRSGTHQHLKFFVRTSAGKWKLANGNGKGKAVASPERGNSLHCDATRCKWMPRFISICCQRVSDYRQPVYLADIPSSLLAHLWLDFGARLPVSGVDKWASDPTTQDLPPFQEGGNMQMAKESFEWLAFGGGNTLGLLGYAVLIDKGRQVVYDSLINYWNKSLIMSLILGF